ncbi:Protein of unknown function [Anaerovirgula multivorans]|uniref:DUF2992 domain-containing protein n=1 Tax=Anaerovirgula multivorans TaxID=312168 RepID=A0A239JK71_9FIRM|nr:YjdF family protein [Anaerovirgula multivorans]SNT06436.1 Protein of unknown function [Anaerovirgula multivorans]
MKISSKFTVLFEDLFWIGIFERTYNGMYEVSRIIFGSEPKDCEVYDFILKEFNNIKFTNSIVDDKKCNHKKINPKRLQRKIKEELKDNGIGTKAQRAMKIQQEINKVEKKKISRKMKEEEQRKKFELKQQKKKEKHKGH